MWTPSAWGHSAGPCGPTCPSLQVDSLTCCERVSFRVPPCPRPPLPSAFSTWGYQVPHVLLVKRGRWAAGAHGVPHASETRDPPQVTCQPPPALADGQGCWCRTRVTVPTGLTCPLAPSVPVSATVARPVSPSLPAQPQLPCSAGLGLWGLRAPRGGALEIPLGNSAVWQG